MTATITDALRPYKGAIMALVTATKPDGSKWTYKEILRDLGMPVNNAYERAVSKMVNKEGHRRRADFKRSKPAEDGGLLPAEEEELVKEKEPAEPPITAERRLAWVASHNYTAYVQTMAMIKADTEHFKVSRFMSWEEESYGVTATALCNDDWFMAAINCMRDGDMGHQGPDGVYERIWWGDCLFPDDKPRPSTIKEVTLFRDHVGLRGYWQDEKLQFVGVFYLPEGPVAVYRKLKDND